MAEALDGLQSGQEEGPWLASPPGSPTGLMGAAQELGLPQGRAARGWWPAACKSTPHPFPGGIRCSESSPELPSLMAPPPQLAGPPGCAGQVPRGLLIPPLASTTALLTCLQGRSTPLQDLSSSKDHQGLPRLGKGPSKEPANSSHPCRAPKEMGRQAGDPKSPASHQHITGPWGIPHVSWDRSAGGKDDNKGRGLARVQFLKPWALLQGSRDVSHALSH